MQIKLKNGKGNFQNRLVEDIEDISVQESENYIYLYCLHVGNLFSRCLFIMHTHVSGFLLDLLCDKERPRRQPKWVRGSCRQLAKMELYFVTPRII